MRNCVRTLIGLGLSVMVTGCSTGTLGSRRVAGAPPLSDSLAGRREVLLVVNTPEHGPRHSGGVEALDIREGRESLRFASPSQKVSFEQLLDRARTRARSPVFERALSEVLAEFIKDGAVLGLGAPQVPGTSPETSGDVRAVAYLEKDFRPRGAEDVSASAEAIGFVPGEAGEIPLSEKNILPYLSELDRAAVLVHLAVSRALVPAAPGQPERDRKVRRLTALLLAEQSFTRDIESYVRELLPPT